MNLSFPKGVLGATIFFSVDELPPAATEFDRWKVACLTSRTECELRFDGSMGRGFADKVAAFVHEGVVHGVLAESQGPAQRDVEPVYTHLGYGLAKAA